MTVCKRFVAVTDAPSSRAAALAAEAATNVAALLGSLGVSNPARFVTVAEGNPAGAFATLTITVQQIPVASAAEAAALYTSLDSASVAAVLLSTAGVTSIQDKSPEVYGASTCFKPTPGGSPAPGASPASPGACHHYSNDGLSFCVSIALMSPAAMHACVAHALCCVSAEAWHGSLAGRAQPSMCILLVSDLCNTGLLAVRACGYLRAVCRAIYGGWSK